MSPLLPEAGSVSLVIPVLNMEIIHSSQNKESSSFPCCSSWKCYQLLWLQRSCVHTQRGTAVGPRLLRRFLTYRGLGSVGLSRQRQLCAGPTPRFFCGFHLSAAVPGRLLRLAAPLMCPAKAFVKLSLYSLDWPLGGPGPETCTKCTEQKTFPSREEDQAAGRGVSCSLLSLFSRAFLLPQLGAESSCLCVTL